jgi:hypothetical protein
MQEKNTGVSVPAYFEFRIEFAASPVHPVRRGISSLLLHPHDLRAFVTPGATLPASHGLCKKVVGNRSKEY